MNLNECFFFKVFRCQNNQKHNYEKCYFYHNEEDSKRIPLNFPTFLDKFEKVQINKNNILGFNSKNNELLFYMSLLNFSNHELDDELYQSYSPGYNLIEYKYHIFNYKSKECEFDKLEFKCPLGKLCYNYHKGELNNEEHKKQFDKFKNFIYKITKKGVFIYLNEIVDMYFYILDIQNQYLSQNIMEINKEKYKHLLNENKLVVQKINEVSNQDLINEISKNKKIYSIGDNFFNALQLEQNSIFFISLIMPKNEVITKVITSFLNSHDGYLIIGGDENSDEIKGIKYSRKKRDVFKIWFNTTFINILIEYEGNLKYEFFDLDKEEMCILKIFVKKVENKKLIKDKFNNEWFIISKKFLDRYNQKKQNRLSYNDIKRLNTKEYIEIVRKKFIDYYTNKLLK